MAFDTEFAEQLTARFREGNPDAKYMRRPVVSRRQLVAGLYDDIMAKRSAGYSVEGIAEYFGTLGAPIKVSTLKSYLMRSGRRPGQKVGGGPLRKRTRAHTPGRLRPDQSCNPQEDAAADGSEAQPDTTSTPAVDPATEAATDSTPEGVEANPEDAAASSAPATPAPPVAPSTMADAVSARDSEADATASTPSPTEADVGKDKAKDEVSHDSAVAPPNEAPSVPPALEGKRAAVDAVTVKRPLYSGTDKSVHTVGFSNINFVPRGR